MYKYMSQHELTMYKEGGTSQLGEVFDVELHHIHSTPSNTMITELCSTRMCAIAMLCIRSSSSKVSNLMISPLRFSELTRRCH
jgi:hypothetical protein